MNATHELLKSRDQIRRLIIFLGTKSEWKILNRLK